MASSFNLPLMPQRSYETEANHGQKNLYKSQNDRRSKIRSHQNNNNVPVQKQQVKTSCKDGSSLNPATNLQRNKVQVQNATNKKRGTRF